MRAIAAMMLFIGTAFAVEQAKIVIHPEEILRIRVIRSEVEITVLAPQPAMLGQHAYPVVFVFPFRLPADIGDTYVGQTRWSQYTVTLRLALKDSKAAASLAAFLEARRPKGSNKALQPTALWRCASMSNLISVSPTVAQPRSQSGG